MAIRACSRERKQRQTHSVELSRVLEVTTVLLPDLMIFDVYSEHTEQRKTKSVILLFVPAGIVLQTHLNS